MASLHTVKENIKKISTFAALSLGIILILFFGFRLSILIKEFFFPTPPKPPTVAFGKLPPLDFENSPSITKIDYALDTVSGTLPTTVIGGLPETVQKNFFPDRVKIHSISDPQPNLLALENVESRVQKIGFISPPIGISPNLYRFSDLVLPNRTMIVDIVSYDFNLTSDYIHNTDSLASESLPTEKDAQAIAKNFLENLSVLPHDIDDSKTKTTLLRVENEKLAEATSFATSHLMRVDFFQNDVSSLPIVYKTLHSSIMNIFVAGGRSDSQIVEAHFVHQEPTSQFATYPIKTAKEAFEDLKQGKSFISDTSSNTIRIKNVFLAYYISEKRQKYLTPVVVFEGNDGFYAYVNAVKNEWIEE